MSVASGNQASQEAKQADFLAALGKLILENQTVTSGQPVKPTTGGLDFTSVDNIQITMPNGGTKLSGKKAVDYLINGKVTGAKLVTTAIRF